jgi:hypothetical protein
MHDERPAMKQMTISKYLTIMGCLLVLLPPEIEYSGSLVCIVC